MRTSIHFWMTRQLNSMILRERVSLSLSVIPTALEQFVPSWQVHIIEFVNVDELEEMIVKYNFRQYILDALDLFSCHLHDEKYSVKERERYSRGFICFLRLLCIITYDMDACNALTQRDYHSYLRLSTSIKQTGEENDEVEQSSYFTNSLHIIWSDEVDNPLVSYLMSQIFRNLSCCGRRFLFLWP